MLEFLLASDFSPPVTAAMWCTVASVLASALLLVYTLELRIRRRITERQRARISNHWRTVIATSMIEHGGSEAVTPPRLPRRQRREFLRLWNQTRNMVEGGAEDRLIALMHQLKLVRPVRRQARHSHLGKRMLAIRTLGYLKDEKSWQLILDSTEEKNTFLSITAAEALVQIDPERAVNLLIPKIAWRRDWPRTHVFRLLQTAGSEAVGEPLFRSLRTAPDDEVAWLLQFAALAEFDVRDAMAAETIARSEDPNALAAALKVSSGYGRVPRLHQLAAHPVWYVRMQAAKLLGRTARPGDAALLESMLDDDEWWVRFRAATALASLPTLDDAGLAALRSRLTDRFAQDALDQAIAEASLK